ncbi:MAG: hypothetical protein ACNA8H_07480 [Anaerolineales bacterium]
MVTSYAHQLLERATALLPVSDEELIYKGVAACVSERMIVLKKAAVRLQQQYGSLDALENRFQTESVSPDDHTLYTDLLEWRAITQEMSELVHLLEDL